MKDEAWSSLIDEVRNDINAFRWKAAEQAISKAMMESPHAAQPHNLMGIMMEKKNDHIGAMKHFRAAWALDPTYLPARENMDRTATFGATKPCVYDEAECPKGNEKSACKIVYDERGIGHVVRRSEV